MRFSDAKRDHYRILARENGYRSRSAYKLIQLNLKYKLFRKGDVVVDIGCAPGGWLQVLVEQIGSNGKIIGVDLHSIEPLKNVILLQGSVEDAKLADNLLDTTHSYFDVLLSDLSPRVSGIWQYDHVRQISLSLNALQLALKILRDGGNAIFKVFEGEMANEFKEEVANNFSAIVISKPKASRQESSEFYIVCKNHIRKEIIQPVPVS
jgi:23S rRNA (uridine2552-2'-O)-methyltransferase